MIPHKLDPMNIVATVVKEICVKCSDYLHKNVLSDVSRILNTKLYLNSELKKT